MCGGKIKMNDVLAYGGAALGFAVGGPMGAAAGYGLGSATGSILNPPKMPEMPVASPAPDQTTASADAAAASLAVTARERRRAVARFGRASTIGAGSVGAPAMGGKQAIGS